MPKNKEVCPHCGQVINNREVTIYSGMVKALVRVFYWCAQNKKHEFKRDEIKHLFKGVDNEIARWGDWRYFGNGMVYKPEGKGTWGLNMKRVRAFINGERTIPTKVLIDRVKGEKTYLEYRTIDEIKNLSEFLNDAKQYIVNYV